MISGGIEFNYFAWIRLILEAKFGVDPFDQNQFVINLSITRN